jgi:hypothetical protein
MEWTKGSAPSGALSGCTLGGDFGQLHIRDRGTKKNAKGMIVFLSELRMCHQQHFTWRKTPQKVNR